MRKRVQADFFRVAIPPGAPPFTDLLNTLTNNPDPNARNIRALDGWYRLHLLVRVGNRWWGSFVRIRMDDLPHVASIEGETRELELEQDEGLGEETSFVYDPRYGILVVQRNFQAVRPGTVEYCLGELTQTDVRLDPVLHLDAIQRVQRMTLVKSVNLRFARPTNPQVYRRLRSLIGLLQTVEQVGAVQINVVMSMGHNSGSLNVARVVSDAVRLAALQRDQGEEIRKVEVKGSHGVEGEPLETIDLLKNRMVESFTVETVQRQLPGDVVRLELVGALENQEDELRRQFGENRR